MQHEMTENDDHLIVVLTGDIDLQTSPQAREILLKAVGVGKSVFVDLAAVEYMDSSGVASLVESFQIARRGGQDYALVSVSDGPRRVLELARLDKVFTIYASIEEAQLSAG